ncbi:uncharacterized protein LAESUDRAFT_762889 [Laetiporus sulphureus 93-53]|uniref:DUF6533 domain-containing protein n=1 Tax=Laetiporus sulphureus 93-53 TaxID=1314785 RepID=A0A165C759_9APHY|nr:uncharacterized protein LAESUDRAFT_762889 [Laetiporus sulphureus 93-53]KZT02318.1 hypothetical protein LAESUDRAFT_762889 [Laetiporus sulphureus 93-53]
MASANSAATGLLQANFLANCAYASGAALIFYEHITTLNQEVKFFWGKRSFPAVLFFINRLVTLIYGAVYIAPTMNIHSQTSDRMPRQSCEIVNYALYGLALAIAAVSLVVTVQRVYAVTERDWRPTIIIALTGIVLLGLDIVEVTIALLVISVVSNVLVLGVIWTMLYKQLGRNSTGVFSQRPSLVALLLRDGTIQFVTLLLLNAGINISTFIGQNAQYVINNLDQPLNTILVSRVLLNIQETARAAQREQSDTPSFVRSDHGMQIEADIDIPSLVIPSDASNGIPAVGPETEPSVATASRVNAVPDETMLAGPSNQHRRREAQEVEVPMEAGPFGQGGEDDVEQRQVEGEAAEDWEEEDDWEDDY